MNTDSMVFLARRLSGLVPENALETVIEYLSSFPWPLSSQDDERDMLAFLIEVADNSIDRRDAFSAILREWTALRGKEAENGERQRKRAVASSSSSSSAPRPAASTKASGITKDKNAAEITNLSHLFTEPSSSSSSLPSTKGVTSSSSSPPLLCGCMSTRHPFFTSCYHCGRIHCGKEQSSSSSSSSSSCVHCARTLFLPISAQELAAKGLNEGSPLLKAYQQKDKLLIFDQENVKRTQVFDAQGDYYESNATSSSWLSEEEKQMMARKEERRKKKLHERRKLRVDIHLFSEQYVMLFLFL